MKKTKEQIEREFQALTEKNNRPEELAKMEARVFQNIRQKTEEHRRILRRSKVASLTRVVR